MGLGANVVKGAVIGALMLGAGNALYLGVLRPFVSKLMPDNTPVEAGYVSPKSLSVERKKNAQGNIETYLQYKVGDEIVSLPCAKGPSGPLCGKVDYWWQSVGAPQREGLVVSEWPAISNDVKHGILSDELQTLIDSAYGTNGVQKRSQQSQK